MLTPTRSKRAVADRPIELNGGNGQDQALTDLDLDYLGWRGDGVHPYPATMPYPLAEELIVRYSTTGQRILDPFVGSGTTIRAAAANARRSIGIDLNPLATLMSRVSVQPLDVQGDIPAYHEAATAVLQRLGSAKLLPDSRWDARLQTWFAPETQGGLARVAAAIRAATDSGELAQYLVDYLLLAFSRTVRLCSLARPGELKLWKRSKAERVEDPAVIFDHEATELLQTLIAFQAQHRIAPEWQPIVLTGDSEQAVRTIHPVDLVVTSPPYGDSWTTVAYGNFSLLSRIWLSAVDPGFSESDPATEDARSTGGAARPREGRIVDSPGVLDLSEHLRSVIVQVAKGSEPRARELELFADDMRFILLEVVAKLGQGAHVVLVLGPRRVSGVPVDTGLVLGDFLKHAGLRHLDRHVRRVTGKRLPSRTSQGAGGVADTINNETIDVFQHSA